MQLMHVDLNINKIQYKIIIWKRKKVKKLIENKLAKTFLGKYLKTILRYKKLFDPKHPFGDLYKTDAIPSSHTACLNIVGLKSYFKDSPVCLD